MKTNTANQTAVKDKKVIFSNSYRNRPELSEEKKAAIKAKRDELRKLSEPLKKKVKQGKISTINEGLKAIYAKKGHKDLRTITEWNEAGYSVNKGEKALLLWGSKKTSVSRETENTTGDPYEFHPICHVFSIKQVTAKAIK